MSDAMRREEVIDMAQYIRETIAEMDAAHAGYAERRAGLAVRLAAIEAATDPAIREAAEDYDRRVKEGRPYEDAEDAEALITEAHRHYAP